MKRSIQVVFVVCAVYMISACTLIQNLMVVNSSDEEIEIQYELIDWWHFQPEVTSERNLNTWRVFQKDWDKMLV